MTTVGTLSKEFCAPCGETTLHDSGACMHCGAEFRYGRARDLSFDPAVKQVRERNARGGRISRRHKQKRPTDIVRGSKG